MSAPSVDIVIDNRDYARFLGRAIDSALAQTHPGCRVIVVDDGSTDASAEVIASYGERVVAVLKPHGGQASAFNAGFAHVTGGAVIFLDSDDALLPDVAARVAAAFEREPAAAKVQYRLEAMTEDGRPTGRLEPPPATPLPGGDLRRAELGFPFDLTWLATSGNAFATRVLREVMPVPEGPFRLGADWYLAHVAPLLGPVVSLEGPGGLRRVHGASLYRSAEAVLDVARLRQAIHYAEQTARELERWADRLGLPVPRAGIRSVSDLGNRMISLRLEPARHPRPDDSVAGLLVAGARAALRRPDLPLRARLLFAAWFLAAALAPRRGVRRLGELFALPERRGRAAVLLAVARRGRRRPAVATAAMEVAP